MSLRPGGGFTLVIDVLDRYEKGKMKLHGLHGLNRKKSLVERKEPSWSR
jgi:hypothetical protein